MDRSKKLIFILLFFLTQSVDAQEKQNEYLFSKRISDYSSNLYLFRLDSTLLVRNNGERYKGRIACIGKWYRTQGEFFIEMNGLLEVYQIKKNNSIMFLVPKDINISPYLIHLDSLFEKDWFRNSIKLEAEFDSAYFKSLETIEHEIAYPILNNSNIYISVPNMKDALMYKDVLKMKKYKAKKKG